MPPINPLSGVNVNDPSLPSELAELGRRVDEDPRFSDPVEDAASPGVLTMDEVSRAFHAKIRSTGEPFFDTNDRARLARLALRIDPQLAAPAGGVYIPPPKPSGARGPTTPREEMTFLKKEEAAVRRQMEANQAELGADAETTRALSDRLHRLMARIDGLSDKLTAAYKVEAPGPAGVDEFNDFLCAAYRPLSPSWPYRLVDPATQLVPTPAARSAIGSLRAIDAVWHRDLFPGPDRARPTNDELLRRLEALRQAVSGHLAGIESPAIRGLVVGEFNRIQHLRDDPAFAFTPEQKDALAALRLE